MRPTSSLPSPEAKGRSSNAIAALVVVLGIATGVALAVGGGDPVLALLPVAAFVLLWGMAKAPLRWSTSLLVLLVLSLEISSDASGLWHTPLVVLGDMLQDNLERSARIPGLFLSGIEAVAIYLLVVSMVRRAKGSTLDGKGFVPAPSMIGGFLLLYLAGTLYADAIGLMRGGGVAFWKVRHLLQTPLLFLLFQVSYRGPSDFPLVGRMVILAASIKSVLGIYIQKVVAPDMTGGQMYYATNHGDSILFCLAAFILIVNVAEREDRKSILGAAFVLPLILAGLNANARRAAWVMLAMALGMAFLMGRPRPWKRTLSRVAILAVPVALLYVAVGWEQTGRIFRPVQTLRSLSDSGVDSSTRWRDVENWNIAMSIREAPILGLGLGHEYTEYVKGDDISSVFADFRGWPHNSVLGLLLFAGPIGFTAIWSLLGCIVFLAARSYRLARTPDERTTAMACIATVIVSAVLAFGDTGAHHAQYRLLVALALAVSGKLAVVTGAWPAAVPRRRGAPSRPRPLRVDAANGGSDHHPAG